MNKFMLMDYGGPGAGKTAFIVSAFWDWKKKEQLRNGRLVIFGQEERDNSLGIPEELVVRFDSPIDKPMEAVEGLSKWLHSVHTLATRKDPKRLEVVAFDGWSEWNNDLIYEYAAKHGDSNKWAKFDAAKNSLHNMIRLLDPNDLDAYVLSTARVSTRRKGIKDNKGGDLVAPDPEWMSDWDYFPALVGWGRENIGHLHEFVLYHEAGALVTPPKGTAYVPHNLHMVPTGQFWIKHKRMDLWLAAGMPNYLTNPTFDDMLEKLRKVRGESAD